MSLVATTTLFGIRKTVGPVIGAILNNWQAALLVILFSIVVYQNTFKTRSFFWVDTIPYLQNIIEEQAKQLDNVIAANETLAASIDDRNAQIQEWKSISDDLEAKNKLVEAERNNLREITKTRVRNILTAPTPPSCEAALDFLRDSVPILQDTPND